MLPRRFPGPLPREDPCAPLLGTAPLRPVHWMRKRLLPRRFPAAPQWIGPRGIRVGIWNLYTGQGPHLLPRRLLGAQLVERSVTLRSLRLRGWIAPHLLPRRFLGSFWPRGCGRLVIWLPHPTPQARVETPLGLHLVLRGRVRGMTCGDSWRLRLEMDRGLWDSWESRWRYWSGHPPLILAACLTRSCEVQSHAGAPWTGKG